MHIGKARRDLDRADGVGRLEGAHGHHQRATERPGGNCLDVGHVDAGNIVALEESQPQAGFQQRLLERERAAERERDEIVAPIAR